MTYQSTLERTVDLPYHGTITRRREIAQQIRNELQVYRREASWSDAQDARLARVHRAWLQLLELENLEQVPGA